MIDVHGHFMPPELLRWLKQSDWPVRARESSRGLEVEFAQGGRTRPMWPALDDVDARLHWMTGAGVRHQVIAPWAELYGYLLPSSAALEWCRRVNAAMVEAVVDRPEFSGIGLLPMQSPSGALQVLAEIADSPLVGAMIGTRIGETRLDDPSLRVIWEAAEDRGVPLMIHPAGLELPELPGVLGEAVGRAQLSSEAGARLLFGRVLRDFPRLAMVLVHGGGGLPFLKARLGRAFAEAGGSAEEFGAEYERLYFDSIVFDSSALGLLVSTSGRGHVLCGSDAPFPISDKDPALIVHDAALGTDRTYDILEGAAMALFGIPGAGGRWRP